MNTLLLPLFLLLPHSAAPSDELAPGEIVEGELAYRCDEFLARLEGLGFSGVVGIEHDGALILVRGYGLADRERGIPVTPDTVFCTGSITKQFTAAAILALQDDGKLSVQDPLAKHLADVPADKRALTLHHLLTHTSGLADVSGDYDLRMTADFVRAQTFAAPLEWTPGADYGYRNVNFSLLGMVIERVSGQPYERFLEERLFDRAGLRATGYQLPRFAPESFAIGYRDGERWGTTLEHPQLADGPCWTLRANGGIQSTVGDMLRWHHALQEDRVLSKAAHALLETPFADEGGGTSYGYGWSIQRSPGGKKLVAHNGGNQVFFADFLRFVEEGHCIFLATNVGSRMRQSLAYELAGILYGRPARAVPETIERDRAWLARYAGRYPLGGESALEIVALDDRLVLSGTGADAAELLCDARTREWSERLRGLTARVCAGDDDAFLAAYGGRQPAESIRAELADARGRWSKALGAFRDVGAVAVRGGEDARIAVEARFERGSAWLVGHVGPGGRLFAFTCADTPPFTGLARVELFPLSAEEFRAYDDRAGLGTSTRFELDAGGRVRALQVDGLDTALARE